MGRILAYSLILLALVSCGTGRKTAVTDSKEPASVQMRVGSYNLWRPGPRDDGYAWDVRKFRLAKTIAEIGFDVFGVQEFDIVIQNDLPGLVEKEGGNYEWFIFSPYNKEGGAGPKAQGIVYRKNRFTMFESHHFWLSPTPDVKSKGWDERKYTRGACCAIFKENATGLRFFLMISHMPLGKEANANAAPVILERAKEYNPESLPSFFVGDLNTREWTESSKLFRSYWNDTFLTVPADVRKGSVGTFNKRGENEDMNAAPRIDYIYYRGEGVKPLGYTCDNRRYEGYYPSDHCPIYADFIVTLPLVSTEGR